MNFGQGVVLRAKKDQGKWDFMLWLPAVGSIGNFSLISQVKARDPSNPDGEEPKNELATTTIKNSELHELKVGQESRRVVEYFSTRDLSTKRAYKPPPRTIVVCKSNFAQVVGPVFGLLVGLHEVVKDLV